MLPCGGGDRGLGYAGEIHGGVIDGPYSDATRVWVGVGWDGVVRDMTCNGFRGVTVISKIKGSKSESGRGDILVD